MKPGGRQLKFAIIVPVQIDGENRYALIVIAHPPRPMQVVCGKLTRRA
jgi:hypothetical protein